MMGRLLPFLGESSRCDSNAARNFNNNTLRRKGKPQHAFNNSMSNNNNNNKNRRRIPKWQKLRKDNDGPDPVPKPGVKTWMRRVMRKENSSSASDGRSGLFQRRYRIRKTRTDSTDELSSPTSIACGRTVTDESSSQYCRSRSEESPHRMMLDEPLSFRDTTQINKFNHGLTDDTRIPIPGHCLDSSDGTFEEGKCEDSEENTCKNSIYLSLQRPSGGKEEQRIDDTEAQNFSIQKSEIINKLFPMGHPSVRKTGKIATEHTDTIQFTGNEKRNKTIKNLDTDEDHSCEESFATQIVRPEHIDWLFPMGHPDDVRKRDPLNDTVVLETHSTVLDAARMKDIDETLLKNMLKTSLDDDDSEVSNISKTSKDQNRDELIGFVFSFDPTWELLTTDEECHTTIKSRLKKIYEIENYADTLLGKLAEEESSSEESTKIFACVNLTFDSESMPEDPVTEETPLDGFTLGYHFDPERFPIIDDSLEIEISFERDDEPSECTSQLVDTENCNRTDGVQKLQFQDRFRFTMQKSEEDLLVDETDSLHSDGGTIPFDDCGSSGDDECSIESPMRTLIEITSLPLMFLSDLRFAH